MSSGKKLNLGKPLSAGALLLRAKETQNLFKKSSAYSFALNAIALGFSSQSIELDMCMEQLRRLIKAERLSVADIAATEKLLKELRDLSLESVDFDQMTAHSFFADCKKLIGFVDRFESFLERIQDQI